AGTVFKYSTAGALTTLVSFNDTNGGGPLANLVQASDGNFYGTTGGGGTHGYGTIFKCTTSGVLTTLVDFDSFTNGASPSCTLIQATDGNLYGVTSGGGKYSNGTIFSCTTSGSLITIYNFPNNCIPLSGVIQGFDGNLYGMTSRGGASDSGNIYKCSTSGLFNTIYSFKSKAAGIFPYCGLIQANDSNLYGMTHEGGTFSDGTLFKCTTAGILTSMV